MKRIDRTAIISGILQAQGLTAAQPNIKLFEDDFSDAQGNVRATIEIGYTNENGKFKLVAMNSKISMAAAIEHFNDRNQIATTIDMAIRAMPEEARPDLPRWVSETSQAQRIEAAMNQVRSIASENASTARKVNA
jgi:hypothetical protein